MKARFVILVVVGCHGSSLMDSSAPTTLDVPKDAITKPVENGPVKVVEKVWPAKPTLGEPIYLRLDITATPGVTVNAPFQEAGDQRMGRFRVVGFTREGAGTAHEEQTYTLESPSSGKHRVPPLRLEMIDGRAEHVGSGSAAKTQELLTDEVPLDIAPVKTEQLGAKLHDPNGKLDPNVGGPPWMKILLALSALAVLGSGTVLVLRAGAARRKVIARRSAYEDAVMRLALLEERGAPEAADADSWFVDLSGIVRGYLEHRYEIRAPELTTEEFLLVASQNTALTSDHQALLSAFLERCDRVKFAGYRPESEESLASLKAARAFVEDTRLVEQAA